jgi:L,D-transpeptidase YcbB
MRNRLIPRVAFSLALLSVAGLPQVALAKKIGAQEDFPTALRKEADGKLRKIYALRGNRPFWVDGGRVGANAGQLLRLLATAEFDGLNPDRFDAQELRAEIAKASQGDVRDLAEIEVKLTEVFARYAADMRKPEDVGMTWLDKKLVPRRPKTETILAVAARAPSFSEFLGSMGWMSPHYQKQRKLFARGLEEGRAPATMARLRLNLERARVLPSPWVHHIVVDSASGRLWYYQAGREKGSMRVVVGKRASPTPMMAGLLQYAILNPYWNVPTDLAQTSLAPKMLKGRTLKSMNMEALSDWGEEPERLKPGEVNWKAVAAGNQEVRIRQLPGPTNSMGKVKFLFPNEEGIFLHDTPERQLFARPSRHYSNGCIRLEDAAGLGQWLTGQPLKPPTKRPEQVVALKVPVPVYLTYLTATEGKGGIAFLDDVYGRDRQSQLAFWN